MNRKQKIIVSVTGIFLVLLILVGLTYAYFLTQIVGNTNEKSISVTTANLELVYGDGNGILEVGDKLRPGDAVTFKTSSGTTVSEKTFTITNNGDDTDYVVIIENVVITDSSGSTTTFESNDFKYTLTCSSSDSNTCDGVTSSTFPLKDSILVGNNIASGTVHTYTLTMEYKETNQNQSADMGKSFTAKINIEDTRRINPYSDNTDSLAYHIINNSMLEKNGTSLSSKPLSYIGDSMYAIYEHDVKIPVKLYLKSKSDITTSNYYTYASDYTVTNGKFSLVNPSVGQYSTNYESLKGKYIVSVNGSNSSSGEDYEDIYSIYKVSPTDVSDTSFKYAPVENIVNAEKILTTTNDAFGTTYYYRGGVEDNFVNFADMCWKIVRIQGDASIKLILEDYYALCNETTDLDGDGDSYTGNYSIGSYNYGYDYDSENSRYIENYLNPSNGNALVDGFKTFQNNFTTKELSKMKIGGWSLWYINSATLNKYNDNTNMYVATITFDEYEFAGGGEIPTGVPYVNYLMNDYHNQIGTNWWLLTPGIPYAESDNGRTVDSGGIGYYDYPVNSSYTARPAINLAKDTEISDGDGTQTNPYIIKMN